ncbi:MAG: thioester domain-containing protein [Methanomicrobiaceae archaeon]|nr:thioester domain-containing protein [Methanomicrobiaceae archaeon]
MKKALMVGIILLAVMMMVGVAAADPIGTGKVKWIFTGDLNDLAAGIDDSYWDATVTVSPCPQVPTGDYLGWCVSGEDMRNGEYEATFYDSRFGNVPERFADYGWNEINWILNNKGDASEEAIQAAIWIFDGGEVLPGYETWDDGADFQYLVDNAEDDFVPGPGDVYAVIVDSGENIQCNIIEVQVPFESPEFPTLAVPVGLLVGMVGAVAVIKGKRET